MIRCRGMKEMLNFTEKCGFYVKLKCPRPDLNRYSPDGPRDFKFCDLKLIHSVTIQYDRFVTTSEDRLHHGRSTLAGRVLIFISIKKKIYIIQALAGKHLVWAVGRAEDYLCGAFGRRPGAFFISTSIMWRIA